jgi:hypothetical protein
MMADTKPSKTNRGAIVSIQQITNDGSRMGPVVAVTLMNTHSILSKMYFDMLYDINEINLSQNQPTSLRS